MRNVARAVVVIALAAGAGAGCHKSAPPDDTPASVSVKARPARVDTIRDVLALPGKVAPAPAAEFTVIAPEACRIVQLPFAEGAPVKAGDVIAKFDLASANAEIASKQTALNEAANALDAAKAELAKQTALYAQSYTPRKTLEAADAAEKAAETNLTHAQAILKATSALADRATVRAPFDGTVVKRWHAEGEMVTPLVDDPVLRIVDPSRVQIVVQVTAGQLLRINPGLAATIADATTGLNVPATVVSRPVLTDASVTTADIRLAPASPLTLPVDTVVEAQIVIEVREAAIVIPSMAVLHSDAAAYVMVAGDDGRAHRRDIVVGLVAGPSTQALSGLAAGDQVIVSPLDQVTDNGPIDIER